MSRLHRIGKAARADRTQRFNNLLHHITPSLLLEAYKKLKRQACPGVDGESWQSYGEGLKDKLQTLHRNIHKGRYHPQPSRRIWLDKPDGSQRPIGVATIEDKIVQQSLVWVIQSVYEVDFLGFSYGFRPKRNPHMALDALYVALTRKRVNWVIDADIQGFFDHIDHDWMMRFLEHRISDKRILNLIRMMLTVGVRDGEVWSKSEVGSPQGAVLSPLLANIYLHYVLDLWIQQWRKKTAQGEVYMVRFADDFVIGCEHPDDVKQLLIEISERMKAFNLSLHQDKTRRLEFGRYAIRDRAKRGEGKPESFNFLGFTHICAKTKSKGSYTVKRITIAKKQRAKLKEVKEWLYKNNHLRIREQGVWLKSVFIGYMNYYGVPGNIDSISNFRIRICQLWKKALHKRGQKSRNLTWRKMRKIIRYFIPNGRTPHPFPNQRFYLRLNAGAGCISSARPDLCRRTV